MSMPLDRGEIDALGLWRRTFDFDTIRTARPWRGFLVTQAGLVGVKDAFLWSVPEPLASEPWLMGAGKDGVIHVAWSISTEEAAGFPVDFLPITDVGAHLSDDDSLLAAQAVALARWHHRDRFCTRCGGRVEVIEAGWASRCMSCAAVEYPRTDPAVIVRITDDYGRLLLAHNATWQEHRMSLLAGFVEAGETPRRAVAREVLEEVGLHVSDIEYLGAQPWPGPRSLMLAFSARARGEQSPVPDGEEIDEVRFFTPEEYEAALADGALRVPSETAIAHAIIRDWLGSGALPVGPPRTMKG